MFLISLQAQLELLNSVTSYFILKKTITITDMTNPIKMIYRCFLGFCVPNHKLNTERKV